MSSRDLSQWFFPQRYKHINCLQLSFFSELGSAEWTEWIGSVATVANLKTTPQLPPSLEGPPAPTPVPKLVQTAKRVLKRKKKKREQWNLTESRLPCLSHFCLRYSSSDGRSHRKGERSRERLGEEGRALCCLPACLPASTGEMLRGCRSDSNMCLCCCGDT